MDERFLGVMQRKMQGDHIVWRNWMLQFTMLVGMLGLFCWWLLHWIRWVNETPEERNIRLGWLGLWAGGLGFLLVGIISLWQIGPGFFR